MAMFERDGHMVTDGATKAERIFRQLMNTFWEETNEGEELVKSFSRLLYAYGCAMANEAAAEHTE